jgi:rhamnose transport system substrate-binding protein
MTEPKVPVLQIKHISKRFDTTQALDDVSLDLYPGEIHALMGENSVAGQIEIVTNATTQGVNAFMISNNAAEQILPAVQVARAKNMTLVTWDSPVPSGDGEQLFVAQVDFNETGKVMADLALNILGADGGSFAVLSPSQDEANQNAWIAAMEEVLKDAKYAKLKLLDVV